MNAIPTESPATNHDTAGTTGAELNLQREAIAALGDELRALVDTTVRTAAPTEALHRMRDEVRLLKGQLTGRRRTRAEIRPSTNSPGRYGCTAP